MRLLLSDMVSVKIRPFDNGKEKLFPLGAIATTLVLCSVSNTLSPLQ